MLKSHETMEKKLRQEKKISGILSHYSGSFKRIRIPLMGDGDFIDGNSEVNSCSMFLVHSSNNLWHLGPFCSVANKWRLGKQGE